MLTRAEKRAIRLEYKNPKRLTLKGGKVIVSPFIYGKLRKWSPRASVMLDMLQATTMRNMYFRGRTKDIQYRRRAKRQHNILRQTIPALKNKFPLP